MAIPRTAAQRQAVRRKRLAQQGVATITVILSSRAARILRDLSRRHHRRQTDVLELALLLAERELGALERQQ